MPLSFLTESQLGYLAGILDGEGCIRIRDNGGNGVVSVHVANTDLPVLEYLQNMTHLGFVYQTRKKKYNSKTARALYAWELSPKHAYILLCTIKHLLIIKKDQAEIAIEYQEIINKHRGKPTRDSLTQRCEIKDSLSIMKRKGEYLAA